MIILFLPGSMLKEYCSPAGVLEELGHYTMMNVTETYVDLGAIQSQLTALRRDAVEMIVSVTKILEKIQEIVTSQVMSRKQANDKQIPPSLMDVDFESDPFGHSEAIVEVTSKGKEAFEKCAETGGRLPTATVAWRKVMRMKTPKQSDGTVYTKQPIMTHIRLDGALDTSKAYFYDVNGELQGIVAQTASGLTPEEITEMKKGIPLLKASTITLAKKTSENAIKTNDDSEITYMCMDPLREFEDTSLPSDAMNENLLYLARMGVQVRQWTEGLISIFANVETVFYKTEGVKNITIAPRSRSLQNLGWIVRHLNGPALYMFTMKSAETITQLEEYWGKAQKLFTVRPSNTITIECFGKICVSNRMTLRLWDKQSTVYRTTQYGPGVTTGQIFRIQPFTNKHGLKIKGRYLYINQDGREFFYDERPGEEHCFQEQMQHCDSLPIPLVQIPRCGRNLITGDAEVTDCAIKRNEDETVLFATCGKKVRLYYTPPRKQKTLVVCGTPEVEEEIYGLATINVDQKCTIYNDRMLNVVTRELKEGADMKYYLQTLQGRTLEEEVEWLRVQVVLMQMIYGLLIAGIVFTLSIASCVACSVWRRRKAKNKLAKSLNIKNVSAPTRDLELEEKSNLLNSGQRGARGTTIGYLPPED